MGYRDDIRDEAVRRDIRYLVHFTLADNLAGIVSHGLLSRNELNARNLDAYASSAIRLDEMDGAVSVSISAINSGMYGAKLWRNGPSQWVVLLLDPAILWSLDCRFCQMSAAKEAMKRKGRMSGHWHFSQMFSDSLRPGTFMGGSYRSETGIPRFFTTLPEAEVQVLEPIPPEAIIHACAQPGRVAEYVNEELKRLPSPQRDVTAMDGFPTFWNGYAEWGCPGPDLAAALYEHRASHQARVT